MSSSNKRKLNSLEQEILIQEQITVANEINVLEYSIANRAIESPKNNRLKFFTFYFTGFLLAILAIFVVIIVGFGDFLQLSFVTQKFLLICAACLIVLMPFFSVGIWLITSHRIKKTHEAFLRADRVMLVRLEKYYKSLIYDFDPEKYKLYDDNFLVDIDENGNLVKYIRFFDEDGSITTKPFTDLNQLRMFIDQEEARKQEEIANKRILESIKRLHIANEEYNQFDMIENNVFSKAIIDDSNIYSTKFIKDTDILPYQYKNKVSKWYDVEQYSDNANFKQTLSSQTYDDNLNSNDYASIDTSWLKEQFSGDEKGSNNFFRQYNLTLKAMADAPEVQHFINIARNLDLNQDPTVNWEDTIDPKDYEKKKLDSYNKAVSDYEESAMELSKKQLAIEYNLSHKNKRILRVELTDINGINFYQNSSPYKNFKKELQKQQRRVRQLNKTRSILADHGIENVNLEGLSTKELKRLARVKIREHQELLDLMNENNNDALAILEANIAKIKAETFEEVHLPNERYRNDDGQWEYYDENNNYFVCDEATNIWSPINSALERFEANKERQIQELQDRYNRESQEQLQFQQRELDEQVNELNHIGGTLDRREKWAKSSRSEEKELKRKLKEAKKTTKEQTKEFKKNYEYQIDEYQKQFDTSANNESNEYVENHEPNEPFVNGNNQWMYHDGQGNYFVANENNEWVPAEKPTQKIVTQDASSNDEFLSPWEKENKQEAKDNKKQEKLDKKAAKQAEKEAARQAKAEAKAAKRAAKEQQAAADDNLGGDNQQQQVETADQQQVQQDQQAQQASGQAQQWQDENGYWWYLDENGNYYYADENGNWIPYENK